MSKTPGIEKIKINDLLAIEYTKGEGVACTPIHSVCLIYRRENYFASAQIFNVNTLSQLQEYISRVSEFDMLAEILEQQIDIELELGVIKNE